MQGDVLARLAAVNVGLPAFAEAIESQGAPVVDVEWRPPARGDRDTVRALERLWGAHGSAVAAANAEVVNRIESAQPRAVAVVPARDALPVLNGRAPIDVDDRRPLGLERLGERGQSDVHSGQTC